MRRGRPKLSHFGGEGEWSHEAKAIELRKGHQFVVVVDAVFGDFPGLSCFGRRGDVVTLASRRNPGDTAMKHGTFVTCSWSK